MINFLSTANARACAVSVLSSCVIFVLARFILAGGSTHFCGGKSVFFALIGSVLVVLGALLDASSLMWSGVVSWICSLFFLNDRISVQQGNKSIRVVTSIFTTICPASALEVSFEDKDAFNERVDVWWLREVRGDATSSLANMNHVTGLRKLVSALEDVDVNVPIPPSKIDACAESQRRWLIATILSVIIAGSLTLIV